MSYEADFAAWAGEQAQALRERRLEALDFTHLAEEVEAMGARERRELRSRLRVLLAHLVKWQHQPEGRSARWAATIKEQRLQLADLLDASPSLRQTVPEVATEVWPHAVDLAVEEVGWYQAPVARDALPWPVDKVLDEGWLP